MVQLVQRLSRIDYKKTETDHFTHQQLLLITPALPTPPSKIKLTMYDLTLLIVVAVSHHTVDIMGQFTQLHKVECHRKVTGIVDHSDQLGVSVIIAIEKLKLKLFYLVYYKISIELDTF